MDVFFSLIYIFPFFIVDDNEKDEAIKLKLIILAAVQLESVYNCLANAYIVTASAIHPFIRDTAKSARK